MSAGGWLPRPGRPRWQRIATTVAAAVALLFLGYAMGKSRGGAGQSTAAATAEAAKPLFWTCSMHPQIRRPEPGLCPICNMQLVPVYAEAAETGPRELAGKWISPMHPEVVKDGPGNCDICGMPLVRAEALGFVTTEAAYPPLVIPASAPLITGERAVVYVKSPNKEGVFEGREVVLGPRAGGFYVVKDGLREGEQVVTKGNFKIDSALQIMAKPSMMSPQGGGPAPGGQRHDGTATVSASPAPSGQKRFDVPGEFRQQLGPVYAGYLTAQKALAGDDLATARNAAALILEALTDVDMSLLAEPAHGVWMRLLQNLKASAGALAAAEDLAAARAAFSALSQTLIGVARDFGVSPGRSPYRFRCPKAFGNAGADWLAGAKEVANPYFGAAMPKCGDLIESISAVDERRRALERLP